MPDFVSRPLCVFLCHSSGDKPAVRELYQKLKVESWIDVWLDEEKLLPGQDWDYEIEKALDSSDAVIVTLSTGSVSKEGYVQKELRFVLDIAQEKPHGTIFILPVRLDDCERPRRLRPFQDIDYFPSERRDLAYARLKSSLERRAKELGIKPEAGSEKTPEVQNQTKTTPEPEKRSAMDQLGIAPRLPGWFVGRENDIVELRSRLTGETNAILQTVVVGWPGIGKTSLVATIAHDMALRPVFSDGVLWTALGQQPKIEDELGNWLVALGFDPRDFPTKETRSNRLAAILRLKRMLLIIDDVWEAEPAELFLVGGYECRTLITTREPRVVRALHLPEKAIYNLLGLSDEASLHLLQELAPEAGKLDPDGVRRLIHALEGSPLGLQVAGRKLAAEFSAGLRVADLLKELVTVTPLLEERAPANLTALLAQTTPTIVALLEISTNRLDPITLERFALLGLFASQPATFDIRAVAAVWEVDDPAPTLRELEERGLIEYLRNVDRYQMHALLAAHARSMLETKV